MAPFAEPAPAKVNLFLHVTGRRSDGYHLLESLAVFARDPPAIDQLEAEPAAQLTVSLHGPFADALRAVADDNLVLRAARALDGARGAALRLTKTLPVASGIGGGSADAAAALRLLNRIWKLGLDGPALASKGFALGADLPVCLRSRATVMRGIGEQLDDAPPLPPFWLVLVNPGIALETRDVFGALNGRFGPAQPLLRAPDSAADLAILLRERRNDLEAPARYLAPEIDQVLAALSAQAGCLLARMSGSGATCFGLFAEPRHAEIAARNIGRARTAWWVVATGAG